MPVLIRWARRLHPVHDVRLGETLGDIIQRIHPLLPPVDALFFSCGGKRIHADDPMIDNDDEICARLRAYALPLTIGPLYRAAILQPHCPSERAAMLERAEEAVAETAHRAATGWHQTRPPFGVDTEHMVEVAEAAFVDGLRLPMLDSVLDAYALVRISSGADVTYIARFVHRRAAGCTLESDRQRIAHAVKSCISRGVAGSEVTCLAFASCPQQLITECEAADVYRAIQSSSSSTEKVKHYNTDSARSISDMFAPMHMLTSDATDMGDGMYDQVELDGIAVYVDRDNLLASTFDQIMMLTQDNFRIGSVVDVAFMDETGVGVGVLRDWMVQTWRDLVDPARGFFCTSPVHPHVLHPNPEGKTWQPDEFLVSMEFAGRMAGVAIRVNAPTGFHLSRAMYRCMTQDASAATTMDDHMRDLAELHPDIARSCTAVLDAADQDELDAMVVPGFAMSDDVSLLPGVSAPDAANVDVTIANRGLLIRLVADHYTGARRDCKDAASAFMRGLCFVTGNADLSPGDMANIMATDVSHDKFNALCGGGVGVPVEELHRRTRVTLPAALHMGGVGQAAVALFWGAVRDMSHEERRGLLRLWTGATSFVMEAPSSVLESMELVCVRDDGTRRLPSSHTCYMQLVIPCCDDLPQRLRLAIEYSSSTAIED